jgi:CheY-like chemotaxis protein/GGDEF domain-containing protein
MEKDGINDDSSLFVFSDEIRNSENDNGRWKVLVVDDDRDFQRSMKYTLETLTILEKKLQVFTASSAAEASSVIAQEQDLALVLLDVVMEEDDSGLRLVDSIRNVLGNEIVRIVILTGQAGLLPKTQVIRHYDVSDFWYKVEISSKLEAIVTSQIRAYQTLSHLETAKKGLQLIVDATKSLISVRNTASFSSMVLHNLTVLLGMGDSGDALSCELTEDDNSLSLMAKTGRYASLLSADSRVNAETIGHEAFEVISQAISTKSHIQGDTYSAFYFYTEKSSNNRELVQVALFKHDRPLDNPIQQDLVKLFCENVSTSFKNLILNNALTKTAFIDSSLGIHNRTWLKRELNIMPAKERESAQLIFIKLNNFFYRVVTFGGERVEKTFLAIISELQKGFGRDCTIVRVSQDKLAILTFNKEASSDEYMRQFVSLMVQEEELRKEVGLTLYRVTVADVCDLDSDAIISVGESGVYTTYCRE